MFKKKFILFYLFSNITNIYNYQHIDARNAQIQSDAEYAEELQKKLDAEFAEELQQEEITNFLHNIMTEPRFYQLKRTFEEMDKCAQRSPHFKTLLQNSINMNKQEIQISFDQNNDNPYSLKNETNKKNYFFPNLNVSIYELLAVIQYACDKKLIKTEIQFEFIKFLLSKATHTFLFSY